MATSSESRIRMLLVSAAAIAAAMALRPALKVAWKGTTGEDPPTQPAESSTGWSEALAWAAVSGAAIGVTRLLARRGAAAGWRATRGKLPSS